MINKRHYLICILSLLNFLSFGQGLTCDQAAPFCAGNAALVFPNTSDNSNAEGGPDYGCLLQQPNPAWYYLQIGQAGDLDISIAQNTQQDFSGIQQDVDFICYGPFTSINNCGNLTASNTIGCGYSTAAVENFTIVNAVAGEIYILLITNFDGGAGFISLEQTNSTSSDAGATDCSIVSTINYCDGEIASLDATNASAVSYVWYQGAVMLAETGPILNNVIAPSASYRVEKLDSGGALIEEEVFNVVFNAVPVANPVTDYFLCDDTVIDGFTEFNLSTKDTEIVGTQTGVTLSYHLEQSEADANTDALPNLFSNTENPQTIYVRIENSLNTNCYDTTSFNLNVYQSPTANQPLDMFVCDDVNNDGV